MSARLDAIWPLVTARVTARLSHALLRCTAAAGQLERYWTAWSLTRQFLVCASIVLVPAMFVIGQWVNSRIKDSVVHSTGLSAALYMENFVEPLVQGLNGGGEIEASDLAKLDRLLPDTSLGQRVVSFKIWTPDGLVVASSRPDLIGQRFVPSAGLKRALSGIAKAEFDHLNDLENAFEKALRVPLLEVYIPLRARGTDKVIAVGEFYEKAVELKADLARAQQLSWLVVGGVGLSMLTALFGIVRHGSRTIEWQQQSLERRVGELTGLLAENRTFRARAQSASARATEHNENYLRRLGADLHDGPAQLISLALLRVEEPSDSQAGTEVAPLAAASAANAVDVTCLRSVLTRALQDVRNIAAGLAVPEIDELSLSASLATVVQRHEQLTGTTVALSCGSLPVSVSRALKLCAYRFVQEGLANAYRHAGGKEQAVSAVTAEGMLVLSVTDRGGGNAQAAGKWRRGLGLTGLTDRIESLGGTLAIEANSGHGARLTARLPLTTGANFVE